ncbi:MAG: class I adenylate-forming enzyme family protein [bacterium]
MRGPSRDEVDRYQMAGQDLPALLDRWVEARPDHPFLVWEPRDGATRTWTYRAFRDEIARIAAGLRTRGVVAGDKVLIHADNCPEAVLSWYACAWIGAVGVTTNTRSVGAEIEYFAEHTGCVGAITQPQYAARIAEHAKKLSWICVTEDDGGSAPDEADARARDAHEPFAALAREEEPLPRRAPEPMRPVGIMFTSGTTSRPKAVVHTHANALWAGRLGPRNIDMTGDDTYLIYLPFFHVNAQSWSIWTALGVGATVVLQPKFSASRFWEVIAKHGVTHVSLIPFVFKAVAGQPVPDHGVRVGVFGLVMPELESWLKMRVLPAYGMTETVIHAIHADPRLPFPTGTMGQPTPGYEFLVMDVEANRICEEGEIGELWVRGTRGIQLFLEYYDNEEANARSFTEDGWFKTGDLVRLGEGGCFFYCDRDKDSLKVGGENVSAREVEDCCRQVGGIGDVAVVARSHEMLDMVPVAFVIKGVGAPEDDDAFAAQIIAHCREKLADFKVPRAVYLVEEFPVATLDKVAKNKLREMADSMPEPE